MKTAPEVILLFKDADGFATAISDGLQPNPSSSFQALKESFELSLKQYGINEKASGSSIHYVDSDGIYQVSILLLQQYEPSVLTCAINEVLSSIARENSSNMPTLILPFLVAASKLKLENKSPMTHANVSLYGKQIGSETDITRAMLGRIQKLPSSLRAMNIPAFIVVRQSDQNLSHKTSEGEFKLAELVG